RPDPAAERDGCGCRQPLRDWHRDRLRPRDRYALYPVRAAFALYLHRLRSPCRAREAEEAARRDRRAEVSGEASRLSLSRSDSETVRVGLRGDWKLEGGLPPSNETGRYLETAGPVRRLAVDGTEIGHWDSSLLAFLVGLQNLCRGKSIQFEPQG